MKKYVLLIVTVVVVLTMVGVWGAAARPAQQVGPAPWQKVVPQPDVVVKAYPSYSQDIQPIFKEFCLACHGPADAHNGLRLDNYEGTLKGTVHGAVIVPGEPAMSTLMTLIKHESAPDIWMPYHKEQLSPNRIKNIENWIRYGARNN